MPAPKPYRYIRRIERSGNTYSWHVAIRRQNKVITKHFSDSTYGGSENALKAAIIFRDQKLKELDTDDYALWKKRLGRHKRNTSGIPGVGRYPTRYKRKDGTIKESYCWQAFWDDKEGKRHIRTFQISIHGEEGAKQQAIEARTQAMLKLYGKTDLTTPEEIQESEIHTHEIHSHVKNEAPPKIRKSIAGKIERGAFLRYSKLQGKYVSYPYWRASWLDDNSDTFSTFFTVLRHGEEQALKLAMEALEKALKNRAIE